MAVADTGALISLELSGLLDSCLDNFRLVIGPTVKKELEKLATGRAGMPTELASSAERVLKEVCLGIELKSSSRYFGNGESECLHLFKKLGADLLVSDDIQFVKAVDEGGASSGRIVFSTPLIALLFRRGIISKQEASSAFDAILTKRSWPENLIYIAGKEALEDIPG